MRRREATQHRIIPSFESELEPISGNRDGFFICVALPRGRCWRWRRVRCRLGLVRSLSNYGLQAAAYKHFDYCDLCACPQRCPHRVIAAFSGGIAANWRSRPSAATGGRPLWGRLAQRVERACFQTPPWRRELLCHATWVRPTSKPHCQPVEATPPAAAVPGPSQHRDLHVLAWNLKRLRIMRIAPVIGRSERCICVGILYKN